MPKLGLDVIANTKQAAASFADLDRQINNLGKGAQGRNALGQFTKAGPSIKELGGHFQKAGAAATVMGASILAAGGLALQMAADYESAWAGVVKTVDASPLELGELRDELLTISETIPKSFEEIAGVAEIAGQLGIASEDVGNFSEQVLRLADSTNIVGEEGALALAKYINVTDATVDQIENLGSAIVAVGNDSKTQEAAILSMSSRMALAGDTAGLSSDQIIGFAATLSSAGIEAEAGGTAFSRFASEMTKSVKTGGDELEVFASLAGTTSAEFKRAFEQDAAGAMVSVVRGLGEFKEAGGDVFTTMEGMGAEGVRLQSAILALTNNVDGDGGLVDTLNLSATAFEENTALAKESGERYKTFDSQMLLLKSTMKNLAVEIGEVLLPIAKDLALEAIELTRNTREWFNELGPLGETLVKAGVALGGLLTVAGTATVVLGTLMANFSAIGAGLTSMGISVTGFGAAASSAFALLTGPIGLTVAAVVGLTAVWVAFGDEITNFTVGLGLIGAEWLESIGLLDDFQNAIKWTKEAFSAVTEFIGKVATAIFQKFYDTQIQPFITGFNFLAEAAGKFFSKIEEKGAAVTGLGQEMETATMTAAEYEDQLSYLNDTTEETETVTKDTGVNVDALAAALAGAKDKTEGWEAGLLKSMKAMKEADDLVVEFGGSIDGLTDPKTYDEWAEAVAHSIETIEKNVGSLGNASAKVIKELGAQIKRMKEVHLEEFNDYIKQDIIPTMRAWNRESGILKTAVSNDQRAVQAVIATTGLKLSDVSSRTQEVEDAFKGLKNKTVAELAELGSEAERNFELIRDSGVATSDQILEAETKALEARKAVAVAAGVELSAEEEKRLAALLAAQGTHTEASKNLFTDWSDGVKSIVNSLGADLATGLFGGGFDVPSIKGKLKSIADSFKTAFFDPVSKLIGGFINGALKTLMNGLAGLAGGQGFGGFSGILGNIAGALGGGGGGGGLGSAIGGLFGIGGGAATAAATTSSTAGITGLATIGGTGGGLFGGLGGAVAGLATNPIGLAVLGSIGAAFMAKKIFSKSTVEKFKDEFSRDFGNVELPKEFIGGLLNTLDITKKQLEPIRKDIASAPITLVAALEKAQQQGKEQAFLASLKSVGTVFGDTDLSGALEFGKATNDFSALNQAFVELFKNSTTLTATFGQELQPLLIDMAANGVTPLTEQIKAMTDAGATQTEIFTALSGEIALQIASAEEFGVALDPLITQFGDMVIETEGLTESQKELLLSFRDLEAAPERLAGGMEVLAADIKVLTDHGATNEQVLTLMGDRLQAAGEAASELGVAIPPVIFELLTLSGIADELDLTQAFVEMEDSIEGANGALARNQAMLEQYGEDGFPTDRTISRGRPGYVDPRGEGAQASADEAAALAGLLERIDGYSQAAVEGVLAGDTFGSLALGGLTASDIQSIRDGDILGLGGGNMARFGEFEDTITAAISAAMVPLEQVMDDYLDNDRRELRVADSVPLLATGGMVTRTGAAIVHEGETVVPAGMGGEVKISMPITVHSRGGDGSEVAREVERLMTSVVIPKLKRELKTNSGGLRSAVNRSVG